MAKYKATAPENGIYINKMKNIDPEVVTRKSRRAAGKLPEKVDPLFPDMTHVNEKSAEEKDIDVDLDLENEYEEPARAEKRAGVNKSSEELELPYRNVVPVDPVPKQSIPPVKPPNVSKENLE